jgi:hypothetical protein
MNPMKNNKQKLKIAGNRKGWKEIALVGIMMFIVLNPFTNAGLLAQNHDQEVTIIAPYRPTINDAAKMNFSPAITDTLIERKPVIYSVQTFKPLFSDFKTEPLSPVLIDLDSKDTMRRNYLKTGFGNYTTPYAEFYSNSLRSDEYSLGFHARHLSSSGQIEDYANSSYSHNLVSLFGKKYLKGNVLSGNLYYKRDVVHYYGFKPEEHPENTMNDDDLKQRFQLVGFDAGLASNISSKNNFDYSSNLNFYNLTDLFANRETWFGISGNALAKNEFFDFVKRQEFGAIINLDFYQNKDSLQTQGNFMMAMEPYIRLNFDYLDLKIGLNGTITADSSVKVHAYPEIYASYQVIPGFLRFYAGLSGELKRNSFKRVSDENPWVNPIFPLNYTNEKFIVKGGFTGNINKTTDYNFKVSWLEVDNMLFLVNNFPEPYSAYDTAALAGIKFTGLYDDVKITEVSLETRYEQSEKMSFLFEAVYRNYNLANQAKPWHKPSLVAKAGVVYKVNDRITVTGELYYESKIYARIMEDNTWKEASRDGFIDLNLGGEYKFYDRISAFVRLNNITATRYYKWYNYPSQRMNAMVGLTFSF